MANHKLEKSYIDELKQYPEKLALFLRDENNNHKRIFVLSKLGHLDKSFNKKPLLDLLSDPNEQIRYLAVKNLAKLGDDSLIDIFYTISTKDQSSLVRREAVSGLGRLRSEDTINLLINLLRDPDPKIAMQAIRGLLVIKQHNNVMAELKNLENHPNETIKNVILVETNINKIKPEKNHAQSIEALQNSVVLGNVLEILNHVPNNSVHLTFTSPPYYNARDYSIYPSYEKYLGFLTDVFQEVYRVTKEGRFFILNTSPIIIPRFSRKYSSKRYPIPYDIHHYLIEIGWEFIDDIIWLKPEASVKNRNAGFLQHRKPLAYKPNPVTELLMVYRKKTDKLIDWNIQQYDLSTVNDSKVLGEYETTNVWKIDPTFDKVHSAVFPMELCNRVISFYSMIGDLVFDPFAGSGTLGKSAIKLNRKFFLTEIEKKYYDTMKDEFSKIVYSKYKSTENMEISFLKMDDFIQRINTWRSHE